MVDIEFHKESRDWEKDKYKYSCLETNPKLEASRWLDIAKDFVNNGDYDENNYNLRKCTI